MLPSSGDEAAGRLAWNDHMAATRQANLTPVGVTAELECKTVGGCFGVDFRTV